MALQALGAYFDGQIDEMRYYNRALTQSEITELYQQGQTKINASQDGKLENGLLAYYSMDGQDINWTAGTITNRGSLGGTGTFGANIIMTDGPVIGKIGQAIDFNTGPFDNIDTGENANLDLLGDITISTWVYRDTSTTNDFIASKMHPATANVPWSFRFPPNSSALQFSHTGTSINSTSTAPTLQWNHVVAVRNSVDKLITFYLNGSQDSAGWQAYTTQATSNIVCAECDPTLATIGARGDTGQPIDGKLDEVRIYNRALSASEITELYQQGQTKINASQDGKLENGLVVYYTMDGADTAWSGASAGTVIDKSPVGTNTGTLNNMSQSTSPAIGKVGQALNLDGSNDSITKTSATGLPQGNNPFSISLWINTPSPATYMYMTEWGVGDTNQWNAFGILTNKLFHTFYGGGIFGNTTLSANTWYHATITYNGTTMKFYLNGAEDKSENPTSTPAVNGSNFRVGLTPSGSPFNGKIDEVRVYNRALSQSEVAELYNMGR